MDCLQLLLQELTRDNLYLKAIKHAKKDYSIQESELKLITPFSVFQLLKKQDQRKEANGEQAEQNHLNCEIISEDRWLPNEYKLFCWLAVCYAYLKQKTIIQFTEEDISFLARIYKRKSKLFLQYHLLCLNKQIKSKKEQWSKEETSLFMQIVRQEKLKGKWGDISYNLFNKSQKAYFRTSHKCREKWFNHLNPVVNHDKWTVEEDISLFKIIGKLGTKWAKISKAMDGVRTEHMVKNRFHSITKKYKSRFQRCSVKRMVQNIIKDLEIKVDNKLTVDEESSQKSNELMVKEQYQEQDLTEEKSKDVKMPDEGMNKNQLCYPIPQPVEFIFVTPEQFGSIQRFTETVENENCKRIESDIMGQGEKEPEQGKRTLMSYQVDYDNMNTKMDTMLSYPFAGYPGFSSYPGGEYMQLTRERHVELIDYSAVEIEYKQTIFSGTN